MAIHIGHGARGLARACVVAGRLLHPARGADRRAASRGPTSRFGSLPAGRGRALRRQAGDHRGRASQALVGLARTRRASAAARGRRRGRRSALAPLGRRRAAGPVRGRRRRWPLAGGASPRPPGARRRAFAPGRAARCPRAGAHGGGAPPFGLRPLFLFFLKVGSVLFGSGYVLLAFLRADLVERCGWLTEAQLLDAVAVGQVTRARCSPPRPSSATCWAARRARRWRRSGIFLPAFVFVALEARSCRACGGRPRPAPSSTA